MAERNPTKEQRDAIQAYVRNDLMPLIESVLVKRLGLAAVFLRDTLQSSCEWHKDDDGIWKSACGKVTAWCFEDGGPEENGCTHCHGCGKPLIVAELVEPSEGAAHAR